MASPKTTRLDQWDLMSLVEDEFDLIFSNFFGSAYPSLYRKGLHWKPPTDFFETEEEFVVILELPQVDVKDVSITYQQGILHIRGVRKAVPPSERRRYHKMEIHYGPFEQRIPMPGDVNLDHLAAHYRDGFLEVRLPKIQLSLNDSIDINVE
ncbi:Hsp20/alpha crystallin family protein [bacterium]|nr:Hsp20/alpha crystallin family protein [bacterium]